MHHKLTGCVCFIEVLVKPSLHKSIKVCYSNVFLFNHHQANLFMTVLIEWAPPRPQLHFWLHTKPQEKSTLIQETSLCKPIKLTEIFFSPGFTPYTSLLTPMERIVWVKMRLTYWTAFTKCTLSGKALTNQMFGFLGHTLVYHCGTRCCVGVLLRPCWFRCAWFLNVQNREAEHVLGGRRRLTSGKGLVWLSDLPSTVPGLWKLRMAASVGLVL